MKVVKRKLAALAATDARVKTTIDALEADSRVRRIKWRDLGERIYNTDVSDLVAAIREWARGNTLDGEKCKPWLPLVRAVGFNTFLDFLQSRDGVDTYDAAFSIAEDLLHPDYWRIGQARCETLGIDIGAYVVWATFAPEGIGEAFASTASAREVACELGFDDQSAGGVDYECDRPLALSRTAQRTTAPSFLLGSKRGQVNR